MTPRGETTWALEPHTVAKLQILHRYLQAWFPIMARWHRRVLYIDGFAGPGRYSGGEEGSPIIALTAATDRRPPITNEVVFLFIELDEDRCHHLRELVSAFPLPPNMRAEVKCGRFDEAMRSVLDEIDRQRRSASPTFAFIDPFGYSHTPFEIVKRIMGHDKCEVLITFMYQPINRFVRHPDQTEAEHRDALFGTAKWRAARDIEEPDPRKEFLHNLYRDQLLHEAGAKYVRSFEMIDRGNRTEYFLFFGTNNVLGLKKMKEAMWKVDPGTGVAFSDTTDLRQCVLFQTQPDYAALRRLILAQFAGREAKVEDIETFVMVETPFRETHYKRQVLKPMEGDGLLEVVSARPGRRTGDFPSGTRIRFE